MPVALSRKQYYTLLSVANRELQKQRAGWCEDDYREVLRQCGATEKDGKPSATTLTVPQMEVALTRFKQLGFKPKRSHRPRDWRAPRIKKLNAMWIALSEAGAINDRSETAMQRWCCNSVRGLNKLQWATSDQLNKAVEMMKQMCKQHGVQTQ